MEDGEEDLTMAEGGVVIDQKIFDGLGDIEILKKEPMAYHTSFHIGGPAEYLVTPHTVDSLRMLVRRLNDSGIEPFIIGAGTNILVGDKGISDVVVKVYEFKCADRFEDDYCYLCGGDLLTAKVKMLSSRGFKCLQWAYGIPGTVGGAVHMNAGAFGSDISEWLVNVEVVDPSGEVRLIERCDINFGYRRSDVSKCGIVVGASFRFEREDPERLVREIDEYMEIRRQRHPLDYPNAGSIFKNPSKETPAGKLIEEVGLKGSRVGDAMVSKKHANFIVNLGRASAKDVLELIRRIQDEVWHKFDIFLEPEICIAGEL
ncbi:MAG TPA: UDP-N-acetylmuramate dehydrogenase [Firmicutes bacterium]|nr:UDP-N-acetylmuramate dehydrogenase [Bacillota bacterium]